MDCAGLAQVTLPVTVTGIESGAAGDAFEDGAIGCRQGACSGCLSLIAITLSPNLTEIGVTAFRGCTSLSEIVLPPDLTELAAWRLRGMHVLERDRAAAQAHRDRTVRLSPGARRRARSRCRPPSPRSDSTPSSGARLWASVDTRSRCHPTSTRLDRMLSPGGRGGLVRPWPRSRCRPDLSTSVPKPSMAAPKPRRASWLTCARHLLSSAQPRPRTTLQSTRPTTSASQSKKVTPS